MSLRSRLHLVRRSLRQPRVAAAALVAAALAAIEVLGRRATSDVADAFALVAFSLVLASASALHRRRSLPGVRTASAWLRTRLKTARELWPAVGLDLREDRSFPQAIPPLLGAATLALLLLFAALVSFVAYVGLPFRATAASVFYLGYLAILGVLWAGLAISAAFMVAIPVVCIHDMFQTRFGGHGRRQRWPEMFAIAGFFAAALAGGLLLPDWLPMLLLGASMVVFMLTSHVLRLPHLTLLWRNPHSGRVAAFDWRVYGGALGLLLVWGYAVILVGALGGAAFGWPAADDATPITRGLGTLAAWLGGPGCLLLALYQADLLRRAWRDDPAAPCPTTVHVTQRAHDMDRDVLRRIFGARGWRLRFEPLPAARSDVCVMLVDPPMRRPADGRFRWPIEVSMTALAVPELLDMLAQRDIVQRRRLLLHGLRALLKRAARNTYRLGTGYWIAPHYWFVVGLTRDTEEEDLAQEGTTMAGGMIGPPYHLAIPLAARQHFHTVLRAVELDILFVEDGVAWRRLQRVFRRLFSHFDRNAGRIEDHDFAGIHGIHVMIHDHELGGLLDSETYPEPDYEDLGRARILHVFKDRGGDEEEAPEPKVDEGLFLPVGP